MIVTSEIARVRAVRWQEPHLRWGFVPTMGYLHEGHLALVRRARAENDKVAVSIFVNPLQFGPREDLSTYPRALQRDLEMLAAVPADLVFTPDEREMYPPGFQTVVTVQNVTRPLEGSSRPTHFQGVATVVAKLFNIVQPTRAYFGQKDAQQTVVVRRMVQDLDFNLEVIVCPTVREADGLAMSSRNAYLSPEERRAAPVLYRALTAAQQAWRAGERRAESLRQEMRAIIAQEKLAVVDYVSVADPVTLEELETISGPALLSLAVFFGKTRLIDNVLLPAA
ncbi:MAG: pantoate--beta-alanine ligase [candidate division KSB1 bacterium]|nr:pantoate--beta-alanine ligase [candidate division KSB1 bacterium]MDZ7274955.1 pantoate--beta-alanine ligase [candidate division KSB1 bacterium]MDZ7286594.1 pantoate--beta-alanine ligase [candidate division KSB1 bacterium]MDZ7299242.1 pantoate--beta-alanine ligase [candidate division KSB1 bacterium]MDZ7308901.1 pantoate--beta-alanine ligase [candidate division KSB1 bacterium]